MRRVAMCTFVRVCAQVNKCSGTAAATAYVYYSQLHHSPCTPPTSPLLQLPPWLPPSLEHLDLSFNTITAVPSSITQLVQLQLLQLNSNKIESFPRCVAR